MEPPSSLESRLPVPKCDSEPNFLLRIIILKRIGV